MIKDSLAYLLHMRDSAVAVVQYTSNHTFEEYSENPWDQAAAVRNLEIIGEAANHVDSEFRKKHSQIPWRDIIDFRNVAIHDYIDLDDNMVWNVITKDVPALLVELNKIIESEDK